MDTTETYIKMCEKAEEIQGQRPTGTDEHDYFYCPVHGLGCDLDKAVWLPRQDQLQEMIDLNNYLHGDIVEALLDWALWVRSEADDNWKVFRQYETGEQLWLAFVMKEKFNKTWDGETWIKEA